MKRKKILVADDDADILEVIQLILHVKGYDVVTENNPEKLLELKDLPDLIFLDIWMSGMDGQDICRRLRNREETKHIPIILLSANVDIKNISAECGATGYLAKPFDMNQMVHIIEKHTSEQSPSLM